MASAHGAKGAKNSKSMKKSMHEKKYQHDEAASSKKNRKLQKFGKK